MTIKYFSLKQFCNQNGPRPLLFMYATLIKWSTTADAAAAEFPLFPACHTHCCRVQATLPAFRKMHGENEI